MSIPKIIWQTYKTKKLPLAATACTESWRNLNPDWHYEFADDQDIETFVKETCSPVEFDAFCQLPLGVMKADFWRYAVLLKHGGVYADLDTACYVRNNDWIGNDSTGLIVGVENGSGVSFCQWAFAARPGHPVLRHAIDLIVKRVQKGIDPNYEHFVHYHTGPSLWTDAICIYLGIEQEDILRNSQKYPDYDHRQMTANRIFQSRELWQDHDISLHPYLFFLHGVVIHLSASTRWAGLPDYDSWTVRKTLLKTTNPLPIDQ